MLIWLLLSLVLQKGPTKMQQIRYLFQNNYGTYYFRYTLPSWYILRFPKSKKWIYISLMTKDMDVAKLRVQSLSLHTQKTLHQIKNTKSLGLMEKEKSIHSIIKNYRNHMANSEPYEQDAVSFGSLDFERLIEHFDDELLLVKSGGLLKFVSEDLSNLGELVEKVKEHQKQKNEMQIDGILHDKLPKTVGQNHTVKEETSSQDISLSELLKKYLENENSDVRVKTSDKMKSHIEFLIQCVGDIGINDFTQSHLREYQSKLKDKTRNLKGKTTAISSVSKNDHLASCRRLFGFAIGHYDSKLQNFFSNSTIYYKGTKKDKKKRIPFYSDELLKIFSHKIFTDGQFQHPYQYWSPLIALFSGSRENEISQLRVSDIIIEDDIHCIYHNLSTDDKRLKTDDERMIPIHPKLIELGFLDFVNLLEKTEYQWEKSSSSHRLFKGLALDKKRGGYQKNLSRWFNGVYDKKKDRLTGFKHDAGILIPDNVRKDFHSFRHTFATALDEVGVLPNIGYMITGHAINAETSKMNSSAGGRYRHGVSVGKMYEEICKLNFDDVLVKVKPFFDINGEKKCRNKIRR